MSTHHEHPGYGASGSASGPAGPTHPHNAAWTPDQPVTEAQLTDVRREIGRARRIVVLLFAIEAAGLVGAVLTWFSVWSVILGALGLLSGLVGLFMLRIAFTSGRAMNAVTGVSKDAAAARRRSFGLIE